MKKILLLFTLCAMLPMVAVAQSGTPTDDTFTVSDLTYDPDMEGYYFVVSLSGSERNYAAYNFDLFLPNGIDVMHDDINGYYVIGSEELYVYNKIQKKYSHNFVFSMPAAHQLRVACYSDTNTSFTSMSGEVFTVYVTLDADVLGTSFSPMPIVRLSGLNLTTSDETKYVPADFACRPFTTGISTSRTLPLNVSADNKVGTLILPFDADLPSGLKAYTCNAIDEDLLTLTPAASFAACTPYIVYAENGYSGSISGTVSFSGDNVTDIFADGFLTGVLSGTTVNTGYILQNQGEGPMFYDAEGVTFSLPAGRCYFTPSITPGVKSFAFNFGDTNGINSIVHCPLSIVNCFDLQGRRVSSPTRGIYIKGTRKVVFTK